MKLSQDTREPTKQFNQIWEDHHSPEMRDLVRIRKQKEAKLRYKGEDLGLDISQNI